MTSSWRHFVDDVITNPTYTKIIITLQQIIAWKWLTPHFFCLTKLYSNNYISLTLYAKIVLTSAIFRPRNRKWRHMTSCDVTPSDFHKTYGSCFFPLYLTTVLIWSHLEKYYGYSEQEPNLGFNMSKYRKIPPTSHGYPITSVIRVQMTWNVPKMFRDKFRSHFRKMGASGAHFPVNL